MTTGMMYTDPVLAVLTFDRMTEVDWYFEGIEMLYFRTIFHQHEVFPAG